jgi:hypothetical protein
MLPSSGGSGSLTPGSSPGLAGDGGGVEPPEPGLFFFLLLFAGLAGLDFFGFVVVAAFAFLVFVFEFLEEAFWVLVDDLAVVSDVDVEASPGMDNDSATGDDDCASSAIASAGADGMPGDD